MGWNSRVNHHTRVNKDISVDPRTLQVQAAAVPFLAVEAGAQVIQVPAVGARCAM